MRIILTATTDDLAAAWTRFCGELPGVEIYRGSILDLKVDAVVSPANSFGFMDGGIDKAYSAKFPAIQSKLQAAIRRDYDGELLVGQAAQVETGDHDIPYLIAAPTMRVPMILKDSVNPYLAARAALRLAVRSLFTSVAFPGLGTGVGQVPPEVCGRQMQEAIHEVIGRGWHFPVSWRHAQHTHQLLYTNRVKDLQHG